MNASTFITEQKRTKTCFEKKYLDAFGNRQERRLDLPGLSPALISKRQELEEIQKKLAEERIGFERWTQDYEHRKNDQNAKIRLYQDEELVHKQFNKQAQNDIIRTKDNTDKEFQQTQKLEIELANLKLKEQELASKLKYLREQIDKCKPCADFLEDIVTATKYFETPEAVLNKYKSLISTKDDWSSTLHNELGLNDKFTQKKARLAFLKNQLIERNHKLSVLREEHEKSIKEKRYKQITVIKNAERTEEKEAEIATILTSIDNICRQVIQNPIQKVKSQMAKQEVPTTVEAKLDIIKNRFLDLIEIVGDPEVTKMVRMEDDLRDFLRTSRRIIENHSRLTTPKKNSISKLSSKVDMENNL
ncbi:hypothetical protein TRFO_37326 [Tritrichomonas foetus]|uniref:DUF4200 domain-containing protein n=1 Tax=Tritrichomonas foetus TaxID=1144522 RepID=A0A1J4JBF6_9EUKA|nr:hypothetical protein TRFO_37326 [Tritrichomonas foetus]|eukprot:OHS96472.1 hypothetical protein TRFO_37326 [Tritrichomonas foetus]